MLCRSQYTYLRISDYIQKANDIRATGEILKDLDLTFDLLLLYGLENLDHAFIAVDDVDTLKDFRVLATANFANDLVIVLRSVTKFQMSIRL